MICRQKKLNISSSTQERNSKKKKEERVKEGIVQETEICKYLGMVTNKWGNLKDHITELNKKCEVTNSAIGEKHQVGKEEFRVKVKLYDTCLMPALLYGFEAWGKIDKDEMNKIEKIQGGSSKKDIQHPNINMIYWLNNGNRYMAS